MKKISKKKKTAVIDARAAMPGNFSTYLNYWADFIEIMCLFNPDRTITLEEIRDEIGDSNIGTNRQLEGISSGEEIDGEPESDRIISRLKDCFQLLQLRKTIYSGYYPFTLKNNKILFFNKPNWKKKFYLCFLLNSNTTIFPNTHRHKWRCLFEQVSLPLFKKYLPNNSEALVFGTAGGKSKNIGGKNLKERLDKLAKKIRFNTTDDYQVIPEKRPGDFEIDLFGHKKFNTKDKTPGTTIGFAQCGCGRNWKDKQLSIHKTKLERIFTFKHDVLSFIIVPHSLRDFHENWERSIDVQRIILLDRVNFIFDISEKEQKETYRHYKGLVDPLLKSKMTVF